MTTIHGPKARRAGQSPRRGSELEAGLRVSRWARCIFVASDIVSIPIGISRLFRLVGARGPARGLCRRGRSRTAPGSAPAVTSHRLRATAQTESQGPGAPRLAQGPWRGAPNVRQKKSGVVEQRRRLG